MVTANNASLPAVSIPGTPSRKGLPSTLAAFAALFLVCLGLSWRSGMLHSEFGRYQDEGMHYITGLFVQDFLTSGDWSDPVRFAQQYYLHLPKLALGQWPPGFSLMQMAWALVFGVSRVSMLWGMMLLTTWLAYLVYREGARYFGPVWGALGAVLLIAAPLTQEHTAMVMAEVPLAAVSFLAICAFVRFLESTRTRDAVVFACWTFSAIMIKGNGWVVILAVPLILIFTGRLKLLLNLRFWLAAGLIGLLSVPYTLFTMSIVSQGWDTRTFPGFAYTWKSLGIHLGFVAHLLGIPLTVVALIGVVGSLFPAPAAPRKTLFWKAILLYAVAIVAFHVGIPSSIEPRKVYQIMPVMCLLVLAGLDTITRLLPVRFATLLAARPALAAIAVLIFMFTGFSLLPEYDPGFGMAVQSLIARPETRGAAILISSNPQWADSEAAIISEWAERQRNEGTYLIRSTKLLSHPAAAAPGQPEFQANFSSPAEILQVLASIPVSYVILHTAPSPISYPHHAMLKAALENDPAEWELVYSSKRNLERPQATHTIEVYRCRHVLIGAPIHYSVDLTGKVGARITTEQ